MKWFKHLSAARDDERIAQLEDIAGLEGYGFYFKLLEIIAASMDQTNRCSVAYSISRWASLTNCHPIKTRTLLDKVAKCGLISMNLTPTSGQLQPNYPLNPPLVEPRLDRGCIEVAIPNLLKHRDNHTKNLQVACKQEVDIEVEQEKETTKHVRKAVALAPRFIEFWRIYPGPRKVQKLKCQEHWVSAGLEAVGDQILLHVGAMAASPAWRKEDGQFIPAPLRYLKERRFEDGTPEKPAPRLIV